jgi:hypothetical protein
VSLQTRLTALAQAIGADVKSLTNRGVSNSFSYPGQVSLYVGQGRWYNTTGQTLTIVNVRASLGSAPSGAAVIVDVNKNGTTVFTTQANRPSIAAAGFVSTKVTPDVTTLSDGDYMTVDIDQIGSSVAGSDLTVTVLLR